MRTVYKWLIGIIITLALLMASLQWIVEPWLERKAHNLLNNNKSINGKAQQIEVNMLRRSIRLDSLDLRLHFSAKEDTSKTSYHWKLSTPHLIISGIAIFPYLFKNEVVVSNLHSENIQLKGLKNSEAYNTANPTDKSRETGLKDIRIRQFHMDSFSISFLDSINGQQTDAIIGLLNGGIELKSDKEGNFKFHSEKTEVIVEQSHVRLPSGYYELNLKKGRLLGDQSQLLLDSLSVQPLMEKYEFSQKYGFRTDRVIGSLTSLKSAGLDIDLLLNEGDIDLSLLEIEGLAFDIFRDARLPFHPEKYEVLLQEKLRKIPFMLTMDSFLIENARIRYEEKRLEHQGTGELLLEDINMMGGLLTNQPDSMKSAVFAVNGSATFMGSSRLEATFNFPLAKENGYHRIIGQLEPMSIVEVNPLLYPLTNFRVKKGYNENAFFDMELDNVAANGEIRLYYRDLHIEIVSRKRGFFNDIKNYLANQIVLNDNPLDGQFRIGHIDYTRDTQRSMFNYWWMALRSGLLESVGLSKEVLK